MTSGAESVLARAHSSPRGEGGPAKDGGRVSERRAVSSRFEYPAGFDVSWHRRLPEFAFAANGVSMLMPYVEPYVVRSVRAVAPRLDGELARETANYLRQEGTHHAAHRRFNDLLVARFPMLTMVERPMRATFDWLGNRRNLMFGVAFAAGFETVAYAAARWVATREQALLGGADEIGSRLFIWHLAEEVEHKAVAVDVYRSLGGSKRTYTAAMVLSLLLLAAFSWASTTVMLVRTRRFFHPMAHLRLLGWTLSFVFELLPTMAMSVSERHHPDQLADPLFYELFLRQYRSAGSSVN